MIDVNIGVVKGWSWFVVYRQGCYGISRIREMQDRWVVKEDLTMPDTASASDKGERKRTI